VPPHLCGAPRRANKETEPTGALCKKGCLVASADAAANLRYTWGTRQADEEQAETLENTASLLSSPAL